MVPLSYPSEVIRPNYPPMDRLYMELLENKTKVRPDLRTKEFEPLPNATGANIMTTNTTNTTTTTTTTTPSSASIIPIITVSAAAPAVVSVKDTKELKNLGLEEIKKATIKRRKPTNILDLTDDLPTEPKNTQTTITVDPNNNIQISQSSQSQPQVEKYTTPDEKIRSRELTISSRDHSSRDRENLDYLKRSRPQKSREIFSELEKKRHDDRHSEHRRSSHSDDKNDRNDSRSKRHEDRHRENQHNNDRKYEERHHGDRKSDDPNKDPFGLRKFKSESTDTSPKEYLPEKKNKEYDDDSYRRYKKSDHRDSERTRDSDRHSQHDEKRRKEEPSLEDLLIADEKEVKCDPISSPGTLVSAVGAAAAIGILAGAAAEKVAEKINTPPSLSEIASGNVQVDHNGVRNIQYVTKEEETDSSKKRDLEFKFRILRKAYKDAQIPDVTSYMDLKTMERIYDDTVRQLSLDSTVENYTKYLQIGLFVVEFVMTKFFKIEIMNGFTQQQLLGMNQYEKLLLEIGEKSYFSGKKQWPAELRLMFIILVNTAVFIGTKMLFKATGSNVMNMINPQKPTTEKKKMKGPDIDIDKVLGKKYTK